MNKTTKQWFDIDRAGLAKILQRKGVEFAVFELVQNAWDEAGVTTVEVTLEPADERGYAMLTVIDDAPEGFKDLTHAYTLFADSAKKANAEQRGRFNIGEKLVLALCKWAQITTTKGTVFFDKTGRGQTSAKRDHGTHFQALIKMTRTEVEMVGSEMKKLIPPATIKTTYNGAELKPMVPQFEITESMPTEIADAEGNLRKATRKTQIRVYNVIDGETPMIYEMGIPVVEHDCAYHCDIQQKVQLTIDRENVTPWFLKALRVAVFNATHAKLTTDEINHEWTQTAIESGHAEPEAIQDYMGKRFGELRASYDPSDLEANSSAVANGYTIVHGSMLTGEAWQAVRGAGAITPAGRIFPTHPDDFVPFQPAQITDKMKAVALYAKNMATVLLEVEIDVEFGEQASREVASWASRRLQFNVKNLGKRWFDLTNNRLAIDDLIIHEFGHHYETNHLSEGYYNALSRLAAKAMQAVREGRLI
jgi:hypothetical protein